MLPIVELAIRCIGMKEADGSFRTVIDTYNSYTPLPNGYKMRYSDPWCAGFISYLAIKCGLTDIIPVECGCERQINLFKKLGEWQEDESVTPEEGWIVYYDWQDGGKGDNTGWSDHVGIVEKCDGKTITVIEGNKSNSVARRCIGVNARYIRGYGIPKYNASSKPPATPKTTSNTSDDKGGKKVTVTLTQLSKGSKGSEVRTLQILLNVKNGAKLIVDGDFGTLTRQAVIAYQKSKGLTQDGIVGKNTWTSLLTA